MPDDAPMPRRVTFWFDFVSPYSWLALEKAPAFAAAHDVEFVLRPVVFGAILDACGLVGPGEVVAKRDGALRDIQIHAADLGVPFAGPPAHPFRSLAALRAACLWQDRDGMMAACRALAGAAWAEGGDLAELATIERALRSCGELDVPTDLAAALQDPAIKSRLRQNTEEAVGRGVYGVPTFEAGGELFWGQDRLEHVRRALDGTLPPIDDALRAMLARPIAAGRRRAPESG